MVVNTYIILYKYKQVTLSSRMLIKVDFSYIVLYYVPFPIHLLLTSYAMLRCKKGHRAGVLRHS